MSFNATFYQFSKKKNSTKVPSSGGTTYAIEILEPSTILSPVIRLKTSNPVNFNYCRIPTYDRYYFVTDWTSDHNTWIAHLSVDVLATWKTDILNSSQYVLRSASKTNLSIPDSVYPVTSKRTVQSLYVDNPIRLTSGTKVDYVLGVLNFDGTSNSKINGIQYLVLTESQMQSFIYSMLTQDYYGIDSALTLLGFNSALMHALINPAQYIVESYILPHSAMGSINISEPKLGPWALPNVDACKAISDGYSYNTTTFSGTAFVIPAHPQTQTHGIYLNSTPYSHHVLHAGPFGDIPLDFVPAETQPTIKYSIKMDFKGNCQLLLMDNDLNILVSSYANASVPIPIIATSDKSMQGISAIGSEISSGITSFGMSLASSSGRLTNALVDFIPSIDSSGINAGVLSINQEWFLTSEFYDVAGNVVEGGGIATNIVGSPLCEAVLLSTLSGYCLCDQVAISLPAYEQEIDQIISYLSSGFFIEE